jgi:hypothetical protein
MDRRLVGFQRVQERRECTDLRWLVGFWVMDAYFWAVITVTYGLD